MSISTKTGDDGSTSLLFGRRVSKTHTRVCAYAGVDELNSVLGLCRAHSGDAVTRERLLAVQKNLIPLMAELATDDADRDRFAKAYDGKQLSAEQVEELTGWVREVEARSGSFKSWSQPGETPADAFFDQARTTARRAERGLVALRESSATVRPELVAYLNRLADLLWLWGREHA